jgi:hypothetical protein
VFDNQPFGCADRGAEPAPDSGSGAGSLVAGSMEPPESDESNLLALRLLAVAWETFWPTEISPSSEPGWSPLIWPVDRPPDPLALAAASACLLVFFATMSRFSCRKTAGDNSSIWVFRKVSFFRRSFDHQWTAGRWTTSKTGMQCLLL